MVVKYQISARQTNKKGSCVSVWLGAGWVSVCSACSVYVRVRVGVKGEKN